MAFSPANPNVNPSQGLYRYHGRTGVAHAGPGAAAWSQSVVPSTAGIAPAATLYPSDSAPVTTTNRQAIVYFAELSTVNDRRGVVYFAELATG